MNERRGYFVLAAVVLLIDQATKWAAHAFLRDSGAVEVVPNLFNLWYSRNPGGLFGYFRDWAAPGRILLLTLMPIIAIVFIGFFLTRSKDETRSTLAGLGLILGGATGNLVDRIVRGEVIDFLDVYAAPSRFADWLVTWFGTAHWPTFNVADSAIVVGAGLLLLNILRPQPQTRPDDPASRPDAADVRGPV